MSIERLEQVLHGKLIDLKQKGTLKGKEAVITAVIPATGDKGPRFSIEGCGNKAFYA